MPTTQCALSLPNTSLRDQLEARLSASESAPETDALPPVHALVARIKALKAAHTLDATPQ